MKNKTIDVRGMETGAAIEYLCRELNIFRTELVRELTRFDAVNIRFDDGSTLPEYFEKLSARSGSSTEG